MGLWVFSGQGSQWAAMGAELLATEPVFAANVASRATDRPRVRVLGDHRDVGAADGDRQDRVQPTLFAMQVALAASMKAYGVRPDAPGNFVTTTPPQASNENLSCWPYRLSDSAATMS
jgi:polyketide synthase 5